LFTASIPALKCWAHSNSAPAGLSSIARGSFRLRALLRRSWSFVLCCFYMLQSLGPAQLRSRLLRARLLINPRFGYADGELANARDHSHALGNADSAARVQN